MNSRSMRLALLLWAVATLLAARLADKATEGQLHESSASIVNGPTIYIFGQVTLGQGIVSAQSIKEWRRHDKCNYKEASLALQRDQQRRYCI